MDLNAHINELTSQFEDLNQENRDLVINNQLEGIQTNLNEFRHQQALEKKEVSHTEQQLQQQQLLINKEDEYQTFVSNLEELNHR